jgi:hypothetical protein
MSKYWNPEWEKPSVIVSGRIDLDAVAEHAEELKSQIPAGYETKLCQREDGLSRLAIVGPDYMLLVSAPERAYAAEVQKVVGRLTWYLICTRPRIRARDECRVDGETLHLSFDVFLDDGSVDRLDRSGPRPAELASIEVADGGATLHTKLRDGGTGTVHPALLAQGVFAPSPHKASTFDLEVRYIGRARGELANRCALDRLEEHVKYQRVLEEIVTSAHRNRDAWLVLASGTTMNINTFHVDESRLSQDTVDKGANRARSILSTSRRVDITEALLINHFKPPLNDQHTGALSLHSRLFKPCYDADLTGIAMAFSSDPLGLALYTDHVPPRLHHGMTVCL